MTRVMQVFAMFTYLLFCNVAFAQTKADALLGTWYCEDLDKSHFKFIKNASGVYSATITKSAVPSYVGKTAVKDVKYNASKNRWEGTIISLKRNMEVDAVFTIEGNNSLKGVGTVAFFKKTYYWVKK